MEHDVMQGGCSQSTFSSFSSDTVHTGTQSCINLISTTFRSTVVASLQACFPPAGQMSRLPPALLFLTIYNPTLKPSDPIADDDEDAEEQAHILFYTSRERAVSRDKMLRQVGLAKALVNFSEYVIPFLFFSFCNRMVLTYSKLNQNKTIGGM